MRKTAARTQSAHPRYRIIERWGNESARTHRAHPGVRNSWWGYGELIVRASAVLKSQGRGNWPRGRPGPL